jgi:hypothetical protein
MASVEWPVCVIIAQLSTLATISDDERTQIAHGSKIYAMATKGVSASQVTMSD